MSDAATKTVCEVRARVPESLHERLRLAAAKERVSLSRFVSRVLERAVAKPDTAAGQRAAG